jgi:hypothetical protein
MLLFCALYNIFIVLRLNKGYKVEQSVHIKIE